eukprot:gene7513-8310_t
MLSKLFKNYQSKDGTTNKEIVSNLPQPSDLPQTKSISVPIPLSNIQNDSANGMMMYPSTFENKTPQRNRSNNNKKKKSSTSSQSAVKSVSSSPTAVKSNRSKASTPAMSNVAKNSNRWSCPMCTYDNNSSRPLRFCDVCGYDRKRSESLTATPTGASSFPAWSSVDSEQSKYSNTFHDFIGSDARQLSENKYSDYQQSKKAKGEKKLFSNESSGVILGKDVGELSAVDRKVSSVAFGEDNDGDGLEHRNGKGLHSIESNLSIVIPESPVTDQVKQDGSMVVVVSLDEGDDSTEDVAGNKEGGSTRFHNPLTSQGRKGKKRKQSHSSNARNRDDQNSNSHDSVVGDTTISTKLEEDQTVGSPKSQRGVWDEGALKAYPCSRVGSNYQAIISEGPVSQDGDKYVTRFSMNGEADESGEVIDWNKDNDLYEVLWLAPGHKQSELMQEDDCVDVVRLDVSTGERLQNVSREQLTDNSPTSVSQSRTSLIGLVSGSAIVKNDDEVALTAYHAFLCEKKSLIDSESKMMVDCQGDRYDTQIDRFLSSYQKTPVTALNALFRCNYSLQKARAMIDNYLEQSSPGLSKRVVEEQNPLLSMSSPLDLQLTVLNDEERRAFQTAFENFGEAWKDLKIAMGGKYSIIQLKDYFHHIWKHDYRDDYISSKRAYNVRKRVRAAQQRRNPRAKVNAAAASSSFNEPRSNTATDAAVIISPTQEQSNSNIPVVDSIIVECSEDQHGLDSLTESSAEEMKDDKILDVKIEEPVEIGVTFAS